MSALTLLAWIGDFAFDPFFRMGQERPLGLVTLLVPPLPQAIIVAVTFAATLALDRRLGRPKMRLPVIFVCAAILFSSLWNPFFSEAPFVRRLRGFSSAVLSSGDLAILEPWALRTLNRDEKITVRDIASKLSFVRPSDFDVFKGTNDVTATKHLNLIFGGGFGHWGITIYEHPVEMPSDPRKAFIRLSPNSIASAGP